jgi:anti-sigma factor RsiW
MTELSCGYGDDREAAIVAFLYGEADADPSERSAFEAHMRTCARCRADVASLGQVRVRLGAWSPPEPSFGMHNSQSTIGNPQSATRNSQWSWRAIPAWAQVAAALLFLGVSAGLANLDIQYRGLTIRTGWSPRAAAVEPAATSARSADAAATAPWRTDLSALERQLKSEIQAMQSTPAKTVAASSSDAEVSRRVRAMVDESEKRQQRELALRIAELARDVTAQRQADMVKIDRTLGLVQNNVGIEVMKTREKMNQMDLIYRASQQRQ